MEINRTALLWEKASGFRPQPAWAGNAIQDFYDNRNVLLKDMRDYDLSDGLTYFNNKLVVTSSARNTAYCYDVATGSEVWRFTTGGPIRVSATYNRGDIYLGSDDGLVYCLNADTGQKKWSYSPAANTDHRKLLQHGKIVSTMPCRTGVMVVGNTAYCGFSFLPWKKSYFCAVNATTGKELYTTAHTNMTMEGPFAYSAGRIVASMGRLAPKVFNASDGSILATMKNGGGSYLIISPNREIIHAPGNGGGWLDTTNQDKALFGQVSRSGKSAAVTDKGTIFLLNSALKAVVDNHLVYAVSETTISCVNRLKNNTVVWTKPFDCHYSIIMAGKTLFLGGDNQIKAVDAKTGNLLGTTTVKGKVHNLIAGDGYLFASTNEGVTYGFHQSSSSAFTLPAPGVSPSVIPPGNAVLKQGPIARFTGKSQVTISWTTASPQTSQINYGLGKVVKTVSETTPKTEHSLVIDNLAYNKKYVYNITAGASNTPNYELNTFFNFQKNSLSTNPPVLNTPTNLKTVAETIKTDSKLNRGVALVAGVGSGELICNLAKHTQLHVIAIDTDPYKVKTCRDNLHNNKSYGNRITVNHVTDYNSLKWPERFANIICSEHTTAPVNGAFVTKYLNPYHGFAYLNSAWDNDSEDITTSTVGSLLKADTPVPADYGVWNSLYGSVNNSAFNGEGLGGADETTELQVQWIGRPGPLHQADRNGRKTSPLAQNGILYIEGLQRLIVMDAANGCVMWNIEMPGFMRMNTPRDSTNYNCDDNAVYLAVNETLYELDKYTGQLNKTYNVSTDSAMNPGKSWTYDWSYLAAVNDRVVGSAVKKGTAYTNYKGGSSSGWYDSATAAGVVSAVCSENLFALKKADGSELWQYFDSTGLIINPTVTIEDNKVVFIETREADRKSSNSRRLNSLDKDLYLICLNLDNGSKLWEQNLSIVEGRTMVNLSASQGKVVISTSNSNYYNIYAHHLATGVKAWERKVSWISTHHGRHMSRPAIVDNKIYNRPDIIDLHTGALVRTTSQMTGGCGTYSCTANGLFFRNTTISAYSFAKNLKSQTWSRLRPDCWLSMIPACGLMLAPEGGGGCDCDRGWLESSVAFRPVSRPDISFKYSNRTFYSASYKVDIQNLKHRSYQIRYTSDGSEPSAVSSLYTAPVTITKTTTVKAALFKLDSKGSPVKISNTITGLFEKK